LAGPFAVFFVLQYDRWCHTVTLALIKDYIIKQCDSSVWLSSEDCKVWNNQWRNYHQVWNPAHWNRFENPTTKTTTGNIVAQHYASFSVWLASIVGVSANS